MRACTAVGAVQMQHLGTAELVPGVPGAFVVTNLNQATGDLEYKELRCPAGRYASRDAATQAQTLTANTSALADADGLKEKHL